MNPNWFSVPVLPGGGALLHISLDLKRKGKKKQSHLYLKSGPAVNASQIPAPDPAMMREKRKAYDRASGCGGIEHQKRKGPKIKNALARHRKSRINVAEKDVRMWFESLLVHAKRRDAFVEVVMSLCRSYAG